MRVSKKINDEAIKAFADVNGLNIEIRFDPMSNDICVYACPRYGWGVDDCFIRHYNEALYADLTVKIVDDIQSEMWRFRISNTVPKRIDYERISKDLMIGKDKKKPKPLVPAIEKVIFNYPATIVKWKDGTKTIVKVGDHELYDPEKGLAMCIAKKALGNEGNYYETFKKQLKEEENWTSPS